MALMSCVSSRLAKARRIAEQSRSRKNTSGQPKLCAWHAPEVECIAKGESKTPYEFGVKVGIAMTLTRACAWRSMPLRRWTTRPVSITVCTWPRGFWTPCRAFVGPRSGDGEKHNRVS
jgi:hypothetical protein